VDGRELRRPLSLSIEQGNYRDETLSHSLRRRLPRAAAQGDGGECEIGRDDDDCGLSGDFVNEIESTLKER
jgi:hypothetical protein